MFSLVAIHSKPMEELTTNQEVTISEETQESLTIWNNTERGTVAYYIIMAIAGMLIIAAISDYFELQLLKGMAAGEAYSDATAEANDNRQHLIGIIQIILMLISAFTFLGWFRRAYGNLRRMGVKTDHEENMATWFFFIPILCFFRPPQIMHEIWDKTQEKIKELNNAYVEQSSNYAISIWWLLFIVSHFIGRYILMSAFEDKTSIDDYIKYSQAVFVSDFIALLEAAVLLYLIYNVRKIETNLAQEIERNGGTILVKS